jgi:hypothetical protein
MMKEGIDEFFKKSWNVTGTKFTPSHLEWLSWLGQPMLYDGGLCVNRNPEEHFVSDQRRGSLMI